MTAATTVPTARLRPANAGINAYNMMRYFPSLKCPLLKFEQRLPRQQLIGNFTRNVNRRVQRSPIGVVANFFDADDLQVQIAQRRR